MSDFIMRLLDTSVIDPVLTLALLLAFPFALIWVMHQVVRFVVDLKTDRDLDHQIYELLSDSVMQTVKRKNDESDDADEYASFEDLLEKPKRKNDDGLSGWGVYIVRPSRYPFATITDVATEVLIEGVSRADSLPVFSSEADQYDGIVSGDASGVCWMYFWDAGDLCRLELRPVAEEGQGHLSKWEAPADSRKRKHGDHE